MERIKTSIEKARDERERLQRKVIERQAELMNKSTNAQTNLLAREPFRSCSEEQQEALMADGSFMHVNQGETFQFAGEIDGYVHYLLSGAVAIESDNEPKSELEVDENSEVIPLDEAGLKRRTITATSESEIFRVAQSSVPDFNQTVDLDLGQALNFDQGGINPPPDMPFATTQADDTAQEEPPLDQPLPHAYYTETQSGQELASLVDQISEQRGDLQDLSEAPTNDVTLGENTLGFNLDLLDNPDDTYDIKNLQNEISEITAPGAPATTLGFEPEINDEIGEFARELEQQFRTYVNRVRTEERNRYEGLMHKHAAKLKIVAERKLREKAKTIRDRYESQYAKRQQNLTTQYEKLRNFAHQMTRQKAAIYEARRGLQQKLEHAEQLHQELNRLGDQVYHQLDDLDNLMPNESEIEAAVGEGHDLANEE